MSEWRPAAARQQESAWHLQELLFLLLTRLLVQWYVTPKTVKLVWSGKTCWYKLELGGVGSILMGVGGGGWRCFHLFGNSR